MQDVMTRAWKWIDAQCFYDLVLGYFLSKYTFSETAFGSGTENSCTDATRQTDDSTVRDLAQRQLTSMT